MDRMPRKDIQVDTTYGEAVFSGQPSEKKVYAFRLLPEQEGRDNDRYAYGEISVGADFAAGYPDKTGISVYIPYVPLYKQLYIRLEVTFPGGDWEYLTNPLDNGHWFPVYVLQTDSTLAPIKLSEMGRINAEGNFYLRFGEGYLTVYSGEDTDFVIEPALRQNEMFLLKSFAGNLYQYPATGVGLLDFLHSSLENTSLAAKLQSEFENDGMIINSAYMDSLTGELLLDVTEKNG